MLSYHADMDAYTNPYELGLGRLVDLELEAEFIGKAALKAIAQKGLSRKQVGIQIGGEPLIGSNNEFWPVLIDGEQAGKVTSAVYSPRLKSNIALAMVAIEHTTIGTALDVVTSSEQRSASVVEKPFYDPKKNLSRSAAKL